MEVKKAIRWQKMMDINWTSWEKYLPLAKVETRTQAAALCMKPWDQILPNDGAEVRMAIKEPPWRTMERYLKVEVASSARSPLWAGDERPEKVPV